MHGEQKGEYARSYLGLKGLIETSHYHQWDPNLQQGRLNLLKNDSHHYSLSQILVTYHLHGESSWSMVCANGKQKLQSGKFCSRLSCTICAVHSYLQTEIVWNLFGKAQGPGTGRKRQMEHNFLLDIPIGNFRVLLKMFLTIYS